MLSRNSAQGCGCRHAAAPQEGTGSGSRIRHRIAESIAPDVRNTAGSCVPTPGVLYLEQRAQSGSIDLAIAQLAPACLPLAVGVSAMR